MRGIGEKVRSLRNARRWTQDELAKRAKINIETVVRMEADLNVGIAKIWKVADALEVKLGHLIPQDQLELASKAGSIASEIAARIPKREILYAKLGEILTGSDPFTAYSVALGIEGAHARILNPPPPTGDSELDESARTGDRSRLILRDVTGEVTKHGRRR